MSGSGYRCGGCGVPVPADEAICSRCGAWLSTPAGLDYTLRGRLAGDEPATLAAAWQGASVRGSAPAVRATLRDGPEVRRRSAPTVSVPVLVAVVLLALLVGGLGVVVGQRSGGDDAAPRVATADPRPDPTGDVVASGTSARCWTGTTVSDVGDCPPGPDDSAAGFSWVFGGVDVDRCAPRFNGERRIYTCFLDDLQLNLSRWLSPQRARTYYDADMGAPPDVGPGGRLLWTGGFTRQFGERRFKVAALYAEGRWSITVYADDRAAARRAQQRYWMRPSSELRAVRPDEPR